MNVNDSPTAILAGRFNESELTAFAQRLAEQVRPPLVIFLKGDLGAGKTTLCRALIQELGHQGRVKSPTYGLMERYELQTLNVLHLDLYRIGDPGELEYLAIADLFDEHSLLLVEWPERGRGALPQEDIQIELEHSDDARFVYLKAYTQRGYAVCRALTEHCSN